MVAGRDAFVGDLEEPLRRARKSLVSHAEARRAHADALGKRQRNLLAQIAAPGGLRAVTEAIKQGLAGLMDVCEEATVSNGYVVEDFRDAPMRVRGWFATVEDAQKFAAQFGEHGWVRPAEAAYEAAAAVAPRVAELATRVEAVKQVREESLENEISDLDDEISDLEDEIAELRDRLADLRAGKRRAA